MSDLAFSSEVMPAYLSATVCLPPLLPGPPPLLPLPLVPPVWMGPKLLLSVPAAVELLAIPAAGMCESMLRRMVDDCCPLLRQRPPLSLLGPWL